MLAEKLPTAPATLRVLERAAKSRSVPRPTRDKATALLELCRRVIVDPVLKEKTAARALEVLEARVDFTRYFIEQFISVLPKLLENDKDGSLARFLAGDMSGAPDIAGALKTHLTKKQLNTLEDGWQHYLAGVHLAIQIGRVRGEDALAFEGAAPALEAGVHADTLLFPIMFIRDEKLHPRVAVRTALIDQFRAWSAARYDLVKEWAANSLSPHLDEAGDRLAALERSGGGDDGDDIDLSVPASALFDEPGTSRG